MTTPKLYSLRTDGDVTIVDLLPESLAGLTIQEELGDPLSKWVTEKQPQQLLVNFSRVKLASSDAIGVLIRIRKDIQSYQGTIRLCELDPNVRLSFRLLNLDGTMFQIFDSEDEALASFSA